MKLLSIILLLFTVNFGFAQEVNGLEEFKTLRESHKQERIIMRAKHKTAIESLLVTYPELKAVLGKHKGKGKGKGWRCNQRAE